MNPNANASLQDVTPQLHSKSLSAQGNPAVGVEFCCFSSSVLVSAIQGNLGEFFSEENTPGTRRVSI